MGILDTGKEILKTVGGKVLEVAGNIATNTLVSNNNKTTAVSDGKPDSKNPDNVNSIPELSDILTELKNKQDNESALAYAIKAQLQVLTVISHPKMTDSPFDLMLESLKTAVQRANSEQEKSTYQQKAAIMINSMIFFMEAKLHFDKDKWDKEGQDILKTACEMLADSAVAVMSMTATAGASAKVVVPKLGAKLFDSMIENKGGFLKKIIDWFSDGENLKVYQNEFYSFLELTFEKLLRYKNLFGSSTILRNLILNYKDEIKNVVGDKSKELAKLDPVNQLLKETELETVSKKTRFLLCSIGVLFIILAAILGFSYLFSLFNLWGGDKWVENLANSFLFDIIFIVHFGLLELPILVKIIIVAGGWSPAVFAIMGARNLGFEELEEREASLIKNYNYLEAKRIEKIRDEYYRLLADKLDEF